MIARAAQCTHIVIGRMIWQTWPIDFRCVVTVEGNEVVARRLESDAAS